MSYPIETFPITSDGNTTIGYDADGIAIEWDGNMTTTEESRNCREVREGHEWIDADGQVWNACLNDEEVTWCDPDGNYQSSN